MKYQRGVTLSGVMFWGILLALVAMLGIKVAPSAIEYYKILKDAKATVAGVAAGATVPEVRQAFAKYAEVDHITEFSPQDLDISKEGNQIVISFDYEKKIPLGFNVSLLINYRGTTSGSSAD
ncbi:MAG: DUF4845 domain-containing protein [Dechloromonas sp.]|jgi:hypothetical protein|nr:DUF4845 domain-containing protein [Dechloromonas sp.]